MSGVIDGYVESLRRQRALNAALSCVTAAVVGVILNLSVWFALHTIFRRTETISVGPLQLDVPVWASLEPGALLLGTAALIATLKFKDTEDAIAKGMLATVPAGRFAEAAELGAAIAFLCSPAAGYINGVNLPVDGGRTKSL